MSQICRVCGNKVRSRGGLAETRKLFPSTRVEYMCKICKREQLDAAIELERERLGLPPRPG